MTARVLLLYFASMTALFAACVKPINDGNACFDTSECHDPSVCAATVYGNYCMQRCDQDIVLCEPDLEACLRSSDLGFGGAGGMGGMDTGTDADAGVDAEDEEIWVCLPGQLENPDYIPIRIGTGVICKYSIDCQLGGVCVCLPGANCQQDSPGQNGPTCQEICDPTGPNRCQLIFGALPQCTDLGTGRGFCDPTTVTPN